MSKPRLLMVLDLDSCLISHRLPLAQQAMQDGYEVHVAALLTGCEASLKALGLHVHPLNLVRGTGTPLQELRSLLDFYRLFRRVRPDVLHLVTVKPVLYGGLCARILGIPTLAALSGLGSAFLGKGLGWSMLQWTLKQFFKAVLNHKRIICVLQNPTDAEFLADDIRIPSARIALILGAGVELESYPVRPEPTGPLTFAMAGRLIYDKGIREFLEAAHTVHHERPGTRFLLAGEPDAGNPTSLTQEDLARIHQEGIVTLLGQRSDLAQVFSDSHVVVLPSYREGLPKVLMEAAACARAVITTDVPGCRDAVIPGITGLVVPVRDSNALAMAMVNLAQETELRRSMGRSGRQWAVKAFDIQTVVARHMDLYGSLLRALPRQNATAIGTQSCRNLDTASTTPQED